jgi:hypothetical protein
MKTCRILLLSGVLVGLLAVAQKALSQTPVTVDPKSTYLLTHDDAAALNTTPIPLASLGIAAVTRLVVSTGKYALFGIALRMVRFDWIRSHLSRDNFSPQQGSLPVLSGWQDNYRFSPGITFCFGEKGMRK